MTNKFQTLKGSYSDRIHKIAGEDDYVIGEGNELLKTAGMSVCLGITLYNPENKKGALAHICNWIGSPEEIHPENIIDTLLHQLNGSGNLDYKKLEATLAGELDLNFGEKSKIVRKRINDYKIPIIGEDLGGEEGRVVFLYCDTGDVEVYKIEFKNAN